jgi:N-methylhydantoinase B/oxoprolinase/acetone carboxylase alpha subunit
MKNLILKQIQEAITPSEGRSKMNLSEKAQVLEQIKGYQSLGEVIYRSEGLKEAAQKLSEIIENAERVALQETEEWFDEVTVKRNMKELVNNNKEFGKTVQEITKLQQRVESLYEEIGNNLSRYYEIGN